MKLHLHSHNHHHGEGENEMIELLESDNTRKVRKIVGIGCAVNALLMALKLTVGWLGHSDALVADGFHSLNDFAADLIMLAFVGISFRAADKKYSYGYGKFETFSSFLISSFLLVVAVIIAIEGVESIVEYSHGVPLEKPDIWTVVVVIIAMACKEGLYRFYSSAGRRLGSRAIVANAWHHRIDALASVATLIGVTSAHFFGENFRILDPCASIVIAAFIIVSAIRLFIPSFAELMEKTLPINITDNISSIIRDCDDVMEVRDIKSRKSGHYLIIDVAVCVKPQISVEQGEIIASHIVKALKKEYGNRILPSISIIPYKGDMQ